MELKMRSKLFKILTILSLVLTFNIEQVYAGKGRILFTLLKSGNVDKVMSDLVINQTSVARSLMEYASNFEGGEAQFLREALKDEPSLLKEIEANGLAKLDISKKERVVQAINNSAILASAKITSPLIECDASCAKNVADDIISVVTVMSKEVADSLKKVYKNNPNISLNKVVRDHVNSMGAAFNKYGVDAAKRRSIRSASARLNTARDQKEFIAFLHVMQQAAIPGTEISKIKGVDKFLKTLVAYNADDILNTRFFTVAFSGEVSDLGEWAKLLDDAMKKAGPKASIDDKNKALADVLRGKAKDSETSAEIEKTIQNGFCGLTRKL